MPPHPTRVLDGVLFEINFRDGAKATKESITEVTEEETPQEEDYPQSTDERERVEAVKRACKDKVYEHVQKPTQHS